MPTLNWIGKEAVVKHHKEVPFRLLEPVEELSCGDADNLIVQDDNLDALKALLPRYAGQVKCIYIDPPYNTGNEGWVYNDNVNSAEIKRWLGVVVGKEGETLDRHDRWLCMMYPRLLLLKQFLRDDGAIFVSIDDNEVATLRLLMDEIFGGSNFVAQLVWKARQHLDNPQQPGLGRQLNEEVRQVAARMIRMPLLLSAGLWAALSGGRCHFVMVRNKEWDVIDAEISKVSAITKS